MDARLQRRIQRYGWDKAADHYEAGWRDSLALAQGRLLELANASQGEHVLDIACGTGLVTFPLAKAVGPQGRVVGTDISECMVNTVKLAAKQRNLGSVEAYRADAEALTQLDDNSFDLVTCALGLMYFPDPAAALREVYRLLKPGGRAVFAVWGARKNCGWADIFPIVDARVQSDVCPMFFQLGTSNVLSFHVATTGFSDVCDERLETSLPFADAESAADAAFVGGPVALVYSRFEDDVKVAAREEYISSISQYASGNGYRIPGEFVLVSARKPFQS